MLEATLSTFLYHDVTDAPQESGMQTPGAAKYKHPVQEFLSNLDQIASAGSRLALVPEIDFTVRSSTLLITFDDGGKSAMASADAIERHGWRGHYFITTSFVGGPGFLRPAQIRDLHDRGHCIGSHSHTHPHIFRRLQPSTMLAEWRQSMAILADILGEPVATASIPGGDGSDEVYRSASQSGIRFLFTSEPRLRPWKVQDTICLGRICPLPGTSLARIAGYARFRGYGRARLVRAAKTAIKAGLGPIYPLLVGERGPA